MVWSIPSALVTLLFGLMSPFLNTFNKSTISQYTMVIAPRAIRSNSDFTISLVVITESLDPISFRAILYERPEPAGNKSLNFVPDDKFVSEDPHNSVRIHGPSPQSIVKIKSDSYSADNQSEVSDYKVKTVMVQPNIPEIVTFKFSTDVLPGNYILAVESLNTSLVFHENYTLYVESKVDSIFIETDQSIYQPGDRLRYRVLILDSDTKPINVTQALSISIYDPTKNLVHLKRQVSAENGVFKGLFDALDALGVWEIEAQYKNQRVRKTVECSDQEIPNFQVVIKSPHMMGKWLSVVVAAQYLFGKPVCGTATVTVIPVLSAVLHSWVKTATPITQILEIDGKITVNFTLPSNLTFDSVLLGASVLNPATGLYVNATDKTVLTDTTESDFEISIDSFNFYWPGEPYSINVTVTSKTGRPLSDRLLEFLIAYDEEYLIDSIIEEYQLDANGMAEIMVQVPDEVSEFVHFEVRYAKLRKQVSFKVKYHLHAQVIDINDTTIRLRVASRTPLSHLYYYVVGHGNILLSKVVDCKGENSKVIEFETTFSMVPQCSVVVFYVASNGTIVSDYTNISIAADKWPNPLSVTVSNTALGFNHVVTLTVESSENSSVSISLVDQSSSVLRRGNFLTQTQVYNDLRLYDNAGDVDLDARYSEYYGNMLEPGTIVMTNAVKEVGGLPPPSNISYLRRNTNFDYSSEVLANIYIPVLSTKELTALQNLTKIGVPRSNTSNILLWNELKVDTEKTTDVTISVPDKISSWRLTGFAVSPSYGLGLLIPSIVLTTYKPFFIEVLFPRAVQIGESVTVNVAVHNYLDHKFQVIVFLDDTNSDFNILTDKQVDLEVAPDSVKTLFFVIEPLVLGFVGIQVQSFAEAADDSVEKNLLVRPKGVTITRTLSQPVVVTTSEPCDVYSFVIDVPPSAVPGSIKIQAVVQGDKYSLDLINLPDPPPAPIGGGSNLYFKFREFIASLRLKGAKFPSSMAQRAANKLMSKQCVDGGFRSDDDCDRPGRSADYTAGILRAIYTAQPFITVDTVALFKGFDFLARAQLASGSFANPDPLDVSGVYSCNASLTAYVLFCFVDANRYYPEILVKYQETAHVAISILFDQFNELDILTSALLWASTQLINHLRKEEVRLRLDRIAVKNELLEHSFEYTIAAAMHPNDSVLALRMANRMTRYRVEAEDSISRTGKVSILSTLAELHSRYSLANTEIAVKFWQNTSDSTIVSVDKDNRFLQRKFEISPDTRRLEMEVSGRGFVDLAVNYQYNLMRDDIDDVFNIEVDVSPGGLFGERLLMVCVSVKPQAESPEVSSMAEVTFPAGFGTDKLDTDANLLAPAFKSKELRDGKLLVELTNLNEKPTCFTITLHREVGYISQPLVGSVIVYDPAWKNANHVWSKKDYKIPDRDLIEV